MRTFMIAAAIAAGLAASGCVTKEERSEWRRQGQRTQISEQMPELAKETVYFKDHAGNCFAILWVGDYHGGPAMAAVDCEKNARLLVNK